MLGNVLFMFIASGSMLAFMLVLLVCPFLSINTVDGGNPANQLIGSLSHYLQGFVPPRWLSGISEPSTVVNCYADLKVSPDLSNQFAVTSA